MSVVHHAGNVMTGTIQGNFAVASDGAALYTIPLTLPPGIAGMAPELSLAYSSAGGNQLLGMGWQLTGLSSISRVGAIPAVDGFRGGVSYNQLDRYSLDGQRLVAVEGEYGAANAVYRTELESWRRVVPVYGAGDVQQGPVGFTVQDKNGRVLEYGGSDDARVAAGTGQTAIRTWLLNRVSDSHGNFMLYSYVVADGVARIARIDYTGNRAVRPRRSVRFDYEPRPDPSTHYVGGYALHNSHRMRSIDTYVDEQRVTRFQLDYLAPGATGRSRLGALTQVDADGNSLTPTRLQWQDGDPQLFAASAVQSVPGLPYGGNFLPMDINGDGKIDFLNAYPSDGQLMLDLYVGRSHGTGFAGPFRVGGHSLPWGGQFFPMDVNGDGHTDLLYAWREDDKLRSALFLATPDSEQHWQLRLSKPANGELQLPWGGQLHAADIDGDGASDLVYTERHDQGISFTVLHATGDGFVRGTTTRTTLPYGGTCFCFDLNGDGMADLVYAYSAEGKLRLATLRSDGTSLVLWQTGQLADDRLEYSGALLPMDFNGDGMVDLVHTARHAAGHLMLTPIVSTGAGFVCLPAQSFEQIPYNALMLPGDLNGDGVADLALAVKSASGTMLHTLLSDGQRFRAVTPRQPLHALQSGLLFPIDLNGVGRNGLLNLAPVDGQLTMGSVLPSGEAPDLLTRISTGSGADFTLRYRSLTDAEVYRHGTATVSPNGLQAGGSTAIGATYTPVAQGIAASSPAAVAPLMTAAFPKYVLASYTRADGRGVVYEYRHRYHDAAIDVAGGRGWLGFAQQQVVDADADATTLTVFHQQFPLASMMRASTLSRTRDGAAIQHNSMHYQVLQTSARTCLPLVTEVVTQLYTAGRLDATQRSTSRYDEYGNAILSCELGDGSGAALYTRRAFTNDTGTWRLGYKTAETRSADEDGKQILSDEKFEYAAGSMALICQRVWHDQQRVWLSLQREYDAFGNVTAEIDHAGAVRRSSYDTAFHSFVASISAPPNAAGVSLVTRCEHEPRFGGLVGATDSNGVRTGLRIDGFGRVIARLGPDPHGAEVELQSTTWGQDEHGSYQESRERLDWQGGRWALRRDYLDGFERIWRTVTQAADGVTQVTVEKRYDSRNLVIHETLPALPGETPAVITRSFDTSGRTLRIERPAGDGGVRTDLFDYPDVHTIRLTAAAGSGNERHSLSVHGSFNGKQLPVRLCDATGHESRIAYDALGRTVSTEDAAGNRTDLAYDTLDHKISAKVSNGERVIRAATASHDLLKRTVSKQDARGCRSVMTMDALGRPLSTIENGQLAASYVYDDAAGYGLGRLAAVQLTAGAGYVFAYDACGNQTGLAVRLGGDTHQFRRTFLPSGRPESVQYPDGGVHNMRYTQGGALASVVTDQAWVHFGAYNAAGKPLSIRYGNECSEHLDYNGNQQLQRQRVFDPAQQLLSHTVFAWNKLDDLAAIEDQLSPASSYAFGYDAAGRLLQASGPYATPQHFSYDAAGNLTSKDQQALHYQHGLLAGAGKLAFDYDEMGNTIRIHGAAAAQQFAYDAAGKLTSGGGCSFTYDHQGRRLSKRQPNGTVTWYVMPDYEVVTRADGSRQSSRSLRTPFGLAATLTTLQQGTAVDPLKEPGVPAPGVCYYHRNQINSTTIVTDEAGGVVAQIDYLPFGEISRVRGKPSFRAKFAGRELDYETGLYDFGARYYLPQIGRFITADEGWGGALDRQDVFNPYAYVLNSPVCNVDPTGRNILDAFVSAMETAVDGIKTGVSWLVNNAKQWTPYFVSGALIVAGAVVLATTPLGGPASAAIGGMLLGAGISGMLYAATHRGDDFSWNSWGIQMGIGGAVGLVSGGLSYGATAASSALQAGGNAAFALGAAGRVAMQAAAGAIDGAAGNAFSAWINNLDSGRSAGEGVGWAAVVGGLAGGLGAGVATKLAGASRFTQAADIPTVLGRMEQHGFNRVVHSRVAASLGVFDKALLKMPTTLFGAGGNALMTYGPKMSW